MYETSVSFLSILCAAILKWPVALPIILTTTYLAFKNNPAQPLTVKQFFQSFQVGGHRGSPMRQPENTIASMVQAKNEGADLIEFDVSLTKDGIAVILHDDTLDRTTNASGQIRQFLFKDLSNVNCAAKFILQDPTSTNVSVTTASMPTLEEIVKWAKENKMKMLFDVKDSDAILVEQLNKLFDLYDLHEVGIVCSFFPIVVYRIKKLCPKILTGLTWRRWFYSYSDLEGRIPRFSGPAHYLAVLLDVLNVWSIKSWLPSFLGVDMVLTERSEISNVFVQQQRDYGRYVCAWTVNDIDELNWMRRTLAIPVLTDKPYLIEKIAK
uniref:GP-PDE domain-containing protein n=1 Tax=Panagrolaimus sp. JU765 TaxID=591449 RepID=A0AC34QWH7_9BILA